jgi:hypothetical protein
MVGKRLVLVCGAILFATPLKADVISITGALVNPDDVYTTTFTLGSVSEISIQTWGYAGGTNASGTVIAEGGFDPVVALFSGSGPTATLFDTNDDGTCPPGNFDSVSGLCLDSTLNEIGPAPGTYTLALIVSPNQPNGPTLGDGFAGGGDFTDVFGNPRTGTFAVDIVTTSATSPTPEPSTLMLVMIGFVTTGLWLKRSGRRERSSAS